MISTSVLQSKSDESKSLSLPSSPPNCSLKLEMEDQEIADMRMALVAADKPRGKTGPGPEQTSVYR